MLKVIVIIVFMSSFFVFEKSLGIQHWRKDYIQLSSPNKDGSFILRIKFFDYEFGPFGEHGYLRWCAIGFSTDTLNYAILMECRVVDQVYSQLSTVSVQNEFKTARIKLMKPDAESFKYLKAENVTVNNIENNAYLEVNCVLESNEKIKDLMITGMWEVTGLYCIDHIIAESFFVPEWKPSDLEGKTELKIQNIKNALHVNQIENKSIKVYKEADAIVVNGVERGQNIRIYSSSGSILVNSFVVNNDVAKVVLPTHQMYIVNIGQAHYKVAL